MVNATPRQHYSLERSRYSLSRKLGASRFRSGYGWQSRPNRCSNPGHTQLLVALLATLCLFLPKKQFVCHQNVTAKARVQHQISQRENCGKQSGTQTSLSSSSSVIPGTIIPPVLHIHISSTQFDATYSYQ